jgi:hypothetical protein
LLRNVDGAGTRAGRSRRAVPSKAVQAAIMFVIALALPAQVLAAGPTERIRIRDHKAEFVQVVTDDVCGDVGGGLGLRAGTFTIVETGHFFVTSFEDQVRVSDVETGTYSYDFDDPSIPDVSGYRYTSPFSAVITKNEDLILTENQHEFLPGSPNGITISFRLHVTWHDGEPIVEREFFKVTGCP